MTRMRPTEIVEQWALWQPDAYRVRQPHFLKAHDSTLYLWTVPWLPDRHMPGRVVAGMPTEARESLAKMASDQLANVAPWWIRLAVSP